MIDTLLTSLSSLLDTVGVHDTQLGQLIGNFDTLMTGLAGSRAQLGSAIDNLATAESTTSSLIMKDPDRFSLRSGCFPSAESVHINNQDRVLQKTAELPNEAFVHSAIQFGNNSQVSDAGLACFKNCKNLTDLYLYDTKVSDAGMAYFKDCKNLTNPQPGQHEGERCGTAYFKDCKSLTHLMLDGTKVGDRRAH